MALRARLKGQLYASTSLGFRRISICPASSAALRESPREHAKGDLQGAQSKWSDQIKRASKFLEIFGPTSSRNVGEAAGSYAQRWHCTHQRFLSSGSDGGLREAKDAVTSDEKEVPDTYDGVEEGAVFTEEDRKAIEALGATDVNDLNLEQLEALLENADPEGEGVGILYIKLGQEYDSEGIPPEKILKCGEEALKIFYMKHEQGKDVRSELGMSYHLIGTAFMRMEEYEKSLPFLQKAYASLEEKGGPNSRAALSAVKFMIGEVLAGMGNADEALKELKFAVAEQEAVLGHDHPQLGRSYRKLAEVLTHVLKHQEALPLAEKAIKIHTKAHGEESMEIALDRRLLAVIYMGLEDHEKALAEHKFIKKILSKAEMGSQAVFVDIAIADTEINLERYDDAVVSLQNAIKKVDKGSAIHALAVVNLAKVHERQGKTDDAHKYAEEVLEILENKVLVKSEPLAVAEGYTELGALYERLAQMEKAIDLLKKAHAIYAPIPNQRNAVAGTQAQIGMLLFFTGKVAEAVTHLEAAAESLEGAVGHESFPLAMVLNHLGVANLELQNPDDAASHFERAKAIFNEILGKDHADTMAVARNLVNAYSLLNRLDEAIKYQEEVVQEIEKQGDEFQDMLDDAKSHLLVLKDHQKSGEPMSQRSIHDASSKYERMNSE